MTVSTQTLSRIESLAKLYQTGYRSNTVDATIAKLVALERARLEAEAKDLADHLRAFEQRYAMVSAEFHQRFQMGLMGDDADMFEWNAFYSMWLSVQGRLDALRF